MKGNINKLKNIGGSPRKSSLFFLTAIIKALKKNTLKLYYMEIRYKGWKNILSLFRISGITSNNP